MKIAIYYDTLADKGGAERHVIEMANHLKADIITAGFSERIQKWLPIKTNVFDLGNSTLAWSKPAGILFEAPLRFFLLGRRYSDKYDVHIFTGFSSIYASVQGCNNIWNCLTPNRMLYDLRERKLQHPNIFARFVFLLYVFILKPFDSRVVTNNFNKIIAQTETVQKRIKKYYQMESTILYPPVQTSNFRFQSVGEYYLTVARLTPEKRIELIVESFTEMPEKKLVIVGDGPEKLKIMKQIKGYKNITYIPNCDEEKLTELYGNCLATIYMPIDEDYGLVPLEGMASGKICIGADEGGLKETIVEGKTGYLIPATKESIQKTVREFSKEKAEKMKIDCMTHAQKYNIVKCLEKWEHVIKDFSKYGKNY